MTSKTITKTLTVEAECQIEYTYSKAYRGARDGRFGPALEPDEPEQVEIESIKLNGADVIELFDHDQITAIEEEILEGIVEDREPDYDGD
ncbi:MAG: hypothetical protein PHE17_17990 [Thiothrix sp.]|uniref:hypothetical protein n=1 Tax=Thiothrix sp. TaxID=1032 RepID=UPI002619E3CA|nr:hypothetical protein [Thiothrix sp.]MDD5394912.1 hypothetical protein [Thiothrix sp.]